jgi:predicted esterase
MRRASARLFATRWRAVLAVVAFLVLVPRVIVPDRVPDIRVEPKGAAGHTLVVVLHGMTGRGTLEPMLSVVRRHYPGADLLAPVYTRYFTSTVSNLDAYELSNAIEHTIHEAYQRRKYERIILVGYSMGALVARKVLLWAYGEEDDRIGAKGPREWVTRVERVVSLAGMSRGWSIDPAPGKMPWYRYLSYWAGEKFARLTGTGKLILSMQRGAPFVADSRVQWIALARKAKLPPVVHLLGDRDDIVSIDDSRDLAAASNVVFVTLADTDHQDIVEGLGTAPRDDDVSAYSARRRAIDQAIGGALDGPAMSPDAHPAPVQCPKKPPGKPDPRFATRIVYIMHGIRDYADWADAIRAASAEGLKDSRTVTVPAKYGWFPMIPFLLYYDRHKNVRWFMDAYTGHLADLPCLKRVDFMGHSNGTYILASALQHYRTLKVDRVYFAGSVVPKHYPWLALHEGDRVKQVDNVVASGDWVVAIFPRLFEQIAEWIGAKPTTGVLDLGSAGFRGFEDGSDPRGRIRNIAYTRGGHGAGVDVSDKAKLDALVGFVLDRDRDELGRTFRKVGDEPGLLLSTLSNITWAVWAFLAAVLAGIGWCLWHYRIVFDTSRMPRTISLGLAPFAIFTIVVVLLFFSV